MAIWTRIRSSIRGRLTVAVLGLMVFSIIVLSVALNGFMDRTMVEIAKSHGTAEVTRLSTLVATWLNEKSIMVETLLQIGPSPQQITSGNLNKLLENDQDIAGAFLFLGQRMRIQVGVEWAGSPDLTDLQDAQVADPFQSPDQEWLVPVLRTISDSNGKTIGTIGLLVRVQPIIEQLASTTGSVLVLNQQGQAVMSGSAGELMNGDRRSGVAHSSIRDAYVNALDGKLGADTFSLDGEGLLIANSALPGTDWGVVYSIAVDEAIGKVSGTQSLIFLVSGIWLLLIGGVVYLYAGYLTKPIRALSDATGTLARGRLDQEVQASGEDELGVLANNFNSMVSSLRSLVDGIRTAAGQLVTSAQEFGASAKEAGLVTEQVAATIEDVSAGANKLAEEALSGTHIVEQMATAAQRMAGQAERAGKLSREVRSLATDALAVVDEQNRAALQTASAVEAAEETIAALDEYSERIGRIVEIIGRISGQTNLLALNAAIEAAHAGDRGLGFAVVAEQVRKLAEQTQTSTKEISSLIGEVRQGTSRAVEQMASSRAAADTNRVAVTRTTETFERISTAIERADSEVASILQGLQELRRQTEDVVEVIHSVSAVSTESAASSQEVAAAAEQQTSSILQIGNSAQGLTELAERLHKAVQAFHTGK